MSLSANFGRVLPLLIVGGLVLTIVHDAIAQGQGTAEGDMPRGTRPGKGLAPGLQVQDLGKNGRTYRVSMKKGDEMMSGLTEFAEKHHIKNAHFAALGAVNKGLF